MSALPKIMDSRHARRIQRVQELYAFLINGASDLSPYSAAVVKHADKIDQNIQKGAPKYTIEKIAPVDLAILRLAVYELTIEKKEPPKVIINEAINLAKELAGEKSPGFINAVLGKIYEELLRA